MGLIKVNHNLINEDEKQTGDDTTLIDHNPVPEGRGGPITSGNKDNQTIIVMKGNLSKLIRNMVPLEGKLDEVVLG